MEPSDGHVKEENIPVWKENLGFLPIGETQGVVVKHSGTSNTHHNRVCGHP